jgi:hypothetical protein
MEQCIDMIKQYLEYFRDKSVKPPEAFHPFRQEALELVVKDSSFHPRRFLSRLNRIIIEALQKKSIRLQQNSLRLCLRSNYLKQQGSRNYDRNNISRRKYLCDRIHILSPFQLSLRWLESVVSKPRQKKILP